MSDSNEECHDHSKRITIIETQMSMLLPAVTDLGKKLDKVVTAITEIKESASEQKGKADAKFGTTDMLIMVVLGGVGSYLIGTMVI